MPKSLHPKKIQSKSARHSLDANHLLPVLVQNRFYLGFPDYRASATTLQSHIALMGPKVSPSQLKARAPWEGHAWVGSVLEA